jgi:hypothetical protein
VGTSAAQLLDGRVEPLGELRQLPLQQPPVAVGAVARRHRGERVQRLQQVLHVVGEASAGLVHRLQVGVLAQHRLAPLALVELAHDLREEPHVQEERGRQRHARAELELDRMGETRGVLALLTEAAFAIGRLQRPPRIHGNAAISPSASSRNGVDRIDLRELGYAPHQSSKGMPTDIR